jgi:hypothetical protein
MPKAERRRHSWEWQGWMGKWQGWLTGNGKCRHCGTERKIQRSEGPRGGDVTVYKMPGAESWCPKTPECRPRPAEVTG